MMDEPSSDEELMNQPELQVGEERAITEDGGVIKKLLVEGEGYETPPVGSEVFIHYTGTLLDGTKFDSSVDRGDPFKFSLGQGSVIKGWDTVVPTMKKGEKILATMKPEYAYGANGSPPTIPANATLQFEMELLKWISDDDISAARDGTLVKTTLIPPSEKFEKPRWNAPVTYSVSNISLADGAPAPFLQAGEDIEALIGREQIPVRAVAHAIKQLALGESAKVTASKGSKYIASWDTEKGDWVPIPTAADLVFTLSLSKVAKYDHWSLSADERIAAVAQFKELGNQHFNAKRYLVASKYYKHALSHGESEYGISEEQKLELQAAKKSLALNSAALSCTLKRWPDAIAAANKILRPAGSVPSSSMNKGPPTSDVHLHNDANTLKALLRRGRAKQEMGDWDCALRDFETMHELLATFELEKATVPVTQAVLDTLKKDMENQVRIVKGKQKAQDAKDAKIFGGLLSVLSAEEPKAAASAPATEPVDASS